MPRMKAHIFAVALLAAPIGCGSSEPAPKAAESAPPPPSASAVVEAPPVATATASAEPPKAPEPTDEEKKKAEAAKKLAADRAQMEEDTKSEAARWTPELHAEAKAIAGAKYPTLKAALGAALKAKYRKPGNADRDKYRH